MSVIAAGALGDRKICARDALYLSRFRRINNRAAASPFLLEVTGDEPESVTTLPLPPDYVAERHEDTDKPTLTFSDVPTYENCPLSYRLSNVLGFQPQLVAELGYGKAIHHILRRLADHVRIEERLPSAAEIESMLNSEFYLPFAHAAAFAKLREAAQSLVHAYLEKYSDDLFRVWKTERPFELHLDEAVLTGRADVILDRENGSLGSMALVDYKTATDPKSNHIREFQLAIYSAAGRAEGIDIRAAYVHDLAQGERRPVAIGNTDTAAAKERATRSILGIAGAQFPAEPEKHKCGTCDVRFVCEHGPGR